MSALTTEQVDMALALRELAGEPVPVTPAARELWVRYDIQPSPSDSDHELYEREIMELWDRMKQLNPRADTEGEREYMSRISPLFGHTRALISVFRIRGQIQSLTSERLYVSTSTRQGDDSDEFNFKLAPLPGLRPFLSVEIRRLRTARPELSSLTFGSRGGDVSFDAPHSGAPAFPAFEEFAHLIAPQIRQAMAMAPQALAMLELDLG